MNTMGSRRRLDAQIVDRSFFSSPLSSPFSSPTSSSSKRHIERRFVKYSARQLFEIVADVDSYNKFVPWCVGSSIQARNRNGQEEELEADLEVGFGTLKEKYRSKVMMDSSDESALKIISYSTQTSLLDHLKTIWTFTPGQDSNTCWVTFQIDFKFKSTMYRQISDLFFDEVVENMVKAFVKRCERVHG